jgi:Zn finger protein HypA/HybF involved in hydrogenase expression
MTREEAKHWIEIELKTWEDECKSKHPIKEALSVAIEALEQEPKAGHWITEKWNNKEHYSCSSCQHVVDYEPCYHYCPYCGAKMIEPQESEG